MHSTDLQQYKQAPPFLDERQHHLISKERHIKSLKPTNTKNPKQN
ncbi:hypothetical protein EMIT0215P_130137 [Pseudomonas serboccidentalis]